MSIGHTSDAQSRAEHFGRYTSTCLRPEGKTDLVVEIHAEDAESYDQFKAASRRFERPNLTEQPESHWKTVAVGLGTLALSIVVTTALLLPFKNSHR